MSDKVTKQVLPDPSELKEEILAQYPKKVARKRAKSMVVNEPAEDQEVQANIRTIPESSRSAVVVMPVVKVWCWGLPGIS